MVGCTDGLGVVCGRVGEWVNASEGCFVGRLVTSTLVGKDVGILVGNELGYQVVGKGVVGSFVGKELGRAVVE